jgi:hypothetical protein
MMSGSAYGTLRATGSGTGAAARDFAKESQGLGGLVRLYATYAANVFAVSAAFSALSSAMNTTNMIKSLDQLGASSGKNLGTVAQNIVRLTDGAINLRDSMQAVAQASSAGIASKDIERLAMVAKNASLSLGISMPDALSRLSRGVTKLEPELLDELGLFTKIGPATETYARSIGKTVSSLTDFERRQAFTNAVLKEGEEKFSALGDAVNVNPYDKLKSSLENLAQKGLEGVNTVLGPIVKLLSESPVALTLAVGALGVALVKQALPALGQFKQGLADTAATALQNKVDKAAAADLAKLQQTESIKKAADDRASAEVDKLVAAEKRLQDLKDAGLVKLKKGKDILAKDLESINDKDLAYFQKKADNAKNPAEKQGWLDVKQSIIDAQTANNDYTKAVEKNTADITAERNSSFSVYGANIRAAEAAEKNAEKARIISNASQQASLVGITDGWRLLNAEIAASPQQFSALEKGMLRIRGAFAILAGAASAFGAALNTALNVIGVIVTAFTILDTLFSKNAKQMSDYSSAIDSAEESVANVARTIDILYKTSSGNPMSIKGINALANAFQEVARSAEDAAKKANTAKETMGWWENVKDTIASGFGGGVDKKLAETLASQIQNSFKILDSAGMGDQAREELKKTLGVESVDFESLRLAILKVGTDGVQPTIDKLLELARSLSNTDSRTQKFKSTLDSTNKSYKDYLISIASSDPLFKLGDNVNNLAISMRDLRDNGILGVVAAMNELADSPEKVAFLGPKFTAGLLDIKDALAEDTKMLKAYQGGLQQINKDIEKFQESDAFKSNQQAVASGFISQRKADELAGPEYAKLKQTKATLEEQIKITADSQSFKDAQRVFNIGVDDGFKQGSKLIEDALKNGAELNAIKIARANAQGLTGERKAVVEGKLAQQEIDIRLRAIKNNIDLILNQDKLIAAIEENSAATALDTASREGKSTKEATDRLDAAKIVSMVLADKTKNGVPDFKGGIDKAMRELASYENAPSAQAKMLAQLKLGQREGTYASLRQAEADMKAQSKVAAKGTEFAKIAGRAEDDQRVLAIQGEIKQLEEQRLGLRNSIAGVTSKEMVDSEILKTNAILANKQAKENRAVEAAIETAKASKDKDELAVQEKLQKLVIDRQVVENDLKAAQDRQKLLQAELDASAKIFELNKSSRQVESEKASAALEVDNARISAYASIFENSKEYTNSLQNQNELSKISQDYNSKIAEENASIAEKRKEAQLKISKLSAGEEDAVTAISDELQRQEKLSKNAIAILGTDKQKRQDILEITKKQQAVQVAIDKVNKAYELQRSKAELENTLANNRLEIEQLRLDVQKTYAREFDTYIIKQQTALELQKAELSTAQQIAALQADLVNKKKVSDAKVTAFAGAGASKAEVTGLQGGETEYLKQQTELTADQTTKLLANLDVTKQKLTVQQSLTLEQTKYNEKLALANELSTNLKDTFGLFGDKLKAVGENLGSIVSTLTEGSVRQEKFSKGLIDDQKKLQELKGNSGADEQQIIDLQGKIADDTKKNNKEQLKGDLATISSTKKLFKEKTAAYKLFAAVEKGLALAQLATNAMVLASKLTTEAGVTAAQTAGTTARIPAYITDIYGQTLGKLPMPFGAIAAAGLIALLLSSFGGGKKSAGFGGVTAAQRQETQGSAMGYNADTGEKIQVRRGVLGDETAKSDSIQNSLDLIAKNSVDGLDYDNRMLNALRDLKSAIQESSKALFGIKGLRSGSGFGTQEGTNTGGGFLGIGGLFSKSTTQTIIDSGLQLKGTFLELAKTGGGLINTFEVVSTTTKSSGFFGIGGSTRTSQGTNYKALGITDPKAEKALRDSFSYAANLLTSIGEQAGRLPQEIEAAMAGVNVDELISLRGLTGDDFTKALENVVGAVLDDASFALFSEFEKFAKFGEGMLETVVRVVDTNTKVNQAVKNIGTSISGKLTQSLDVSLFGIKASVNLWTNDYSKLTNDISEALVKSAGGLDKFIDKVENFRTKFLTEAERLEPISSAYRKALTDLGYSADISRDQLKDLIQNFNLFDPAAGRAGKSAEQTYIALLDIAEGFDKVNSSAESVKKGLFDKLAELTLTEIELRTKQINSLDDSNKIYQRQIYAYQDAQKAAKAYQASLQNTVKTLTSQITTLNDYKTSLTSGPNTTLTTSEQYAAAKAQVDSLVTTIKDSSKTQAERDAAFGKLTGATDRFLGLSREMYASSEDYTKDFGKVTDIIDELTRTFGTQKTTAEEQLTTLQNSETYLESIEESSKTTAQLMKAYNDAVKIRTEVTTTSTSAGGGTTGGGTTSGGNTAVTTAKGLLFNDANQILENSFGQYLNMVGRPNDYDPSDIQEQLTKVSTALTDFLSTYQFRDRGSNLIDTNTLKDIIDLIQGDKSSRDLLFRNATDKLADKFTAFSNSSGGSADAIATAKADLQAALTTYDKFAQYKSAAITGLDSTTLEKIKTALGIGTTNNAANNNTSGGGTAGSNAASTANNNNAASTAATVLTTGANTAATSLTSGGAAAGTAITDGSVTAGTALTGAGVTAGTVLTGAGTAAETAITGAGVTAGTTLTGAGTAAGTALTGAGITAGTALTGAGVTAGTTLIDSCTSGAEIITNAAETFNDKINGNNNTGTNAATVDTGTSSITAEFRTGDSNVTAEYLTGASNAASTANTTAASTAATVLTTGANTAATSLTSGGAAAGAAITGASNAATENLTGAVVSATENLTGASNAATENLTGVSNAAAESLTGASNAATENLTGASNAATENLTGASNAATEKLTSASNAATENFTGASNAATELLAGAGITTAESLTGSAAAIKDAGSSFSAKSSEGIVDLQTLGNNLADTIQTSLAGVNWATVYTNMANSLNSGTSLPITMTAPGATTSQVIDYNNQIVVSALEEVKDAIQDVTAAVNTNTGATIASNQENANIISGTMENVSAAETNSSQTYNYAVNQGSFDSGSGYDGGGYSWDLVGGGGGGGGGCPDPATPILISKNGNTCLAGKLKVGDTVWTRHEITGVFDNYTVTFVEIIEQPRVNIQFDDGTDIIVSDTHKFLMQDLVWKQVFQLLPGDVIKGLDVDKTIVSMESLGVGPVVKITVDQAHTYISDGLISHNIKEYESWNSVF